MKIDGKTIVALQKSGAHAWGLHLFEEIITAYYKRILNEGDLVVDGGAHAGLHTIPLADAVGRTGKVLAFEPIPPLVEHLRGLLAERHIQNVQIRREALSRRKGKTTFNWIKNCPALSSISTSGIKEGQDVVETFEVDSVRLDDIISPESNKLRFAKLDLEGAEFDALHGAKQCLMTCRPSIVLEFGYEATAKDWGYDQAAWNGFYDEVEYGLYDIIGRPVLHQPWDELRPPIWYLIAVPKHSTDESFVTEGLQDLIEPIAEEWSRALTDDRRPRVSIE